MNATVLSELPRVVKLLEQISQKLDRLIDSTEAVANAIDTHSQGV